MLRPLFVGFILALGASISGCSSRLDALEARGGRLLIYSKGAVETERDLTATQTASVNSWLAGHRDGWAFDAASYAPEVLVTLKNSDGQAAGLYVYDAAVVYVSGSYQRIRQSTLGETRALKQGLGVPDAG